MMYDTRAYTPDGSGHGTGQASNDKELVLQAMREYGRSKAAELQEASAEMTGTELYAAEDYIPDFAAACAQKNMLERAAGFVCRSTIDSNVWAPSGYPQGWTELGPVGGPFVEEDA